MRFYFRRDRSKGSPRIKLAGVYGSDEFKASYARALHVGTRLRTADRRSSDRATAR